MWGGRGTLLWSASQGCCPALLSHTAHNLSPVSCPKKRIRIPQYTQNTCPAHFLIPPPAARLGPPIAQSVELSLRLAVIKMHGVCFDDVLRMLREHSSELGIQDEACIAAAINKVRMVWVGGRMCGSSPKAGPNSSSASLFAWRPAHGFLARHASLFVSHTSSCLAFFICFLCGKHACAQQLRV